MVPTTALSALSSLWEALDGPEGALARVALEGVPAGLPSIYPVASAATAQVAAATLSVAELWAARAGGPRLARVDAAHVAAAFRSERYLRTKGWELPAVWDAIAGDYEAKDGWIRLHTNYAYHRDAALHVLGVPFDREAVAAAVRRREREALEDAIVEAGGCAAAMRTPEAWRAHPQGAAVLAEPLVHHETLAGAVPPGPLEPGAAPLTGIRVLDLTRVIAGPVCTRFLAAFGADVVRVDAPGFEEVGALLPETTAGKRRVALALRRDSDRRAFERLLARAHVLVSGYRSDALAGLGYSTAALRALRPSLVVASLDAYGWSGPWRARRGFDSLVQMSAGIAARSAEVAGAPRPTPLPAQALDHGTGYLLAAAVCRALTRGVTRGEVSTVRVSLARTARWLTDLGETSDPRAADFTEVEAARWREPVDTPWGPIERVRCPGSIDGFVPAWRIPPGPLGSDAPAWSD